MADEIIRKDFKEKPYLILTIDHSGPTAPPSMKRAEKEEVVSKEAPRKEVKTVKPNKKGDHLSIDAYNGDDNEEYKRSLSRFGKELLQVF